MPRVGFEPTYPFGYTALNRTRLLHPPKFAEGEI